MNLSETFRDETPMDENEREISNILIEGITVNMIIINKEDEYVSSLRRII